MANMTYTRPVHWWRELPPEVSGTDLPAFYRWAMTTTDPRTSSWFSMSTPSLNWGCTLLYLLFIYLGPKAMKHRDAWNVTSVMVVYNALVILFNAYMFFEIWHQTTVLDMSWFCNPVDYSERSTGLAEVLYLYYVSKLLDYSDTFFLVVKKNFRQLTVLHTYHHAFMFWVWWLGIKWAAGGDSYFSAWINCFVHVMMYSYYLASCLGVRLKGKQYLTQLQLLQFFAVITHSSLTVLYDCQYPHWISYSLIFFLLSLVVLFSNFYYHEYLTKANEKKRLRDSSHLNGDAKNKTH